MTATAQPTTETVSSFKSEDSTERLIGIGPPGTSDGNVLKKGVSVSSKSVEAGSERARPGRATVGALGVVQAALGALLVAGGAAALVRGAALSRAGAGLWAGAVAVAAGVVGALAGLHECSGLHGGSAHGRGLQTAFLALSLVALACAHCAAVLAATGLQRDARPPTRDTLQDEKDAWSAVVANIVVLVVATVHCLVCAATIYHLAKRLCPCFQPKQPYDHNQFDPEFRPVRPFIVHVDELKKPPDPQKTKTNELCKELESKLQGETLKKKKEEVEEFGSASSREKLVSRWLGRQTGPRSRRPAPPARPARAQVMLWPAHPASTLGRAPVPVMVPPRYATLPLPPPSFAPVYYAVPDRVRRRRSPRGVSGERRRRGGGAGGGLRGRERHSQLTRSLERIHRKRRSDTDGASDTDLTKTYTGLDRAYAEQFIAACDEVRHTAERPDSLGSASATSELPSL